MAHLPAPKPEGYLGLVPVRQESLQIAKLRLVIGFFRPGTKLDLLDLYVRLFLPGRGAPLVLLKEVLAEIHQPAYRRLSIRRDLDEVESSRVGGAQRLGTLNDTDLLTTLRNETH